MINKSFYKSRNLSRRNSPKHVISKYPQWGPNILVSPGRKCSWPGLSFSHRRTKLLAGCSNSAKGPVSRILSCAVIPLGAALPQTLISDLPGGFGHCIGATLRRRASTGRATCSGRALPSLFGLAPCGVYPASDVTAGAVRSYRTISPLPDWPSRQSPFGPVARAKARASGGIFSVALAVHGF